MTIIEGILFGILQGVAEFLPISSSGHLNLAKELFKLQDLPVAFDVFLHLATILAVILFFYKKIWQLLCAFFRLITRRPAPQTVKNSDGSQILLTPEQALEREKNLRRYILAIILSSAVTAVIGLVNSKYIDNLPIKFTCAGFIVTSALLLISSFLQKKKQSEEVQSSHAYCGKSPSWKQSLIIGLTQGVGTLPGISRSGSTIAGSLLCGMNRADAGEYSFIVSIPAVFGAFILELKDFSKITASIDAAPLIAGFFAAFASGYLALTWLVKLIRNGKIKWFACYLIPLAIAGFIFL